MENTVLSRAQHCSLNLHDGGPGPAGPSVAKVAFFILELGNTEEEVGKVDLIVS